MAKRCLGCMKPKEQSPVCEHCGYNENIPNYPHQLPMGTLLREQYLVGKVLGQGGFGITYMGWDTSLETAVAIKEYFPTSLVSRESSHSLRLTSTDTSGESFRQNRDRFLREARTLAKLHDVPGIVRVHNLFQENDTAYIVMEYVEGIDLKRYIRLQNRVLTVPEILAVMRPVMEALCTVHEAGLVHRDISPDNIMIQPNGKAKLLDFGAAREVANADAGKELPQSTEAILKHGFAPIEQYRRRGSLGPWTDIYALCATMYYCLTGKVPADAPERIMGDDNVNWQQIPGLTPEQIAALEKGMAMMPDQRTGSVQELYNALFSQTEKNPMTSVRHSAPEPKPEKVPEKAPETPPVSQVSGLNNDLRNAYGQSSFSYVPAAAPSPAAGSVDEPQKSVFQPAKDETGYSRTLPLETSEAIPSRPQPVPVSQVTPPPAPAAPETGASEKKTPKKSLFIAIGVVLVLVVCFFAVHFWKDATCLEPETCFLCRKTRGEALGHSWIAATCLEPETCSVCGETQSQPKGHTWQEATCTKGKICTVCREGGGPPLDHDWAPATYTEPKTCRRCHITSGAVKGYLGTIYGGANDETYWRNGRSTYVYELNREVRNCYKLTLEYELYEIKQGNPYGNYELFARLDNGEWFSMGVFKMTEDFQQIPFEFKTPVSFNQVAVICQVGGNYDIVTSLAVTDVYTYSD